MRAAYGLILLLGVAPAARIWRAPFLSWDDDFNILANPFFAAHDWSRAWRAPYYGLYIPVTDFVWQVLYGAGGGSPIPFRILNLGLHAANIVLAHRILVYLAGRWRITNPWAPLIALAFFAFHPLQLEAIAWISGGRDLLGASFALLSLVAYYGPGASSPRRRACGAAGAVLCFALSMLAKPNAVALPVVILLTDLGWARLGRRTVLTILAMGALALGPVWLTVGAQAGHVAPVAYLDRPWVVLDTYEFYLRKFLWPEPLNAVYARPPAAVLAQARALWAGAAFAGAATLAFAWAWWRDRRFWVGALWFAWLAPVSGAVPFGFQTFATVADHYHYLAMLPAGAVAMLLFEHFAAWARPATLAAFGVAHAALFAASWARAPAWAGDADFFADMAAYEPRTYAAGIGMSIAACVERGDYAAGVAWTEVALAARPKDMKALANQAYCYLHDGNWIRVTELEMELNDLNLELVEAGEPTAFASFLASVGTAEVELGQLDVGYQYLCNALRIKPGEPRYRQNLAAAAQILVKAGIEPACDPEFGLAPGDDPEDED